MSAHLNDLREFYRTADAVYYVLRQVNANTRFVCDGLAIDDGGDIPNDECAEVVGAACRAWERVIGCGTTKCVTYFHHARQIRNPVCLAMAEITDDDGSRVEGNREWIERTDLPGEAVAILARAEQAFDAAYEEAVAAVEADHQRRADKWLAELETGEPDDLRRALENPKSCASEEAKARAWAVLEAMEARAAR